MKKLIIILFSIVILSSSVFGYETESDHYNKIFKQLYKEVNLYLDKKIKYEKLPTYKIRRTPALTIRINRITEALKLYNKKENDIKYYSKKATK